jgi:hypothetical protein
MSEGKERQIKKRTPETGKFNGEKCEKVKTK